MAIVPATEASELYALPLDEFTAGRDRLARQLREEGRREEAAAVAAMRKPTTDAWALNQVARRHSKQIEWLLQAQRALREAEDAAAFGEASASRRRLLNDVATAAVAILEEAGHGSTGTVRERIARTLLAAAADAETEQALIEGTLVRPVEISTAWPETALQARPAATGEEIPTRSGTVATPESEAEAVAERMETEARDLADQAERLRRTATRARSALEEAQRRAEEADRAAEAAETAARAAEQRARKARRHGAGTAENSRGS